MSVLWGFPALPVLGAVARLALLDYVAGLYCRTIVQISYCYIARRHCRSAIVTLQDFIVDRALLYCKTMYCNTTLQDNFEEDFIKYQPLLSDPSGTDLSLVFSSSWPVSDYYTIHFLKAHDISSPFFYFLTFEKADCSIFTLSVGWLTSPLIFQYAILCLFSIF